MLISLLDTASAAPNEDPARISSGRSIKSSPLPFDGPCHRKGPATHRGVTAARKKVGGARLRRGQPWRGQPIARPYVGAYWRLGSIGGGPRIISARDIPREVWHRSSDTPHLPRPSAPVAGRRAPPAPVPSARRAIASSSSPLS